MAAADERDGARSEDLEEVERSAPGELEEEEQDDAVIGVALRRSAWALAAIAAVVAAGLLWVNRPRSMGPDSEIAAAAPEAPAAEGSEVIPPTVAWVDVTAAAGIDFVHSNGALGERLLPETMGGGGAFLDFDRDGDQDLLLVNSRSWDQGPDRDPARTALYVNDGSGSFRDEARERGIDLHLYGTGVAVGDVDGDGFPDVFVAAVGTNRFLRNVAAPGGGRRFVDETEASGLGGDPAEWSSSSAFLDYDRDGDLDLFVGNYVRWSPQIDREINYTLTGNERAYGPPVNYQGTFPYLYRNDGAAEAGGPVRFTPVAEQAGLHVVNPATGLPVAKSLGGSPAVIDGDGWIDLMVANDTVQNFLFRNLGDGTFEEVGELLGVAYGRDGNATGAMGIDSAHPRGDSDLAFAIGNFANEMSSFYVSQGSAELFADEAIGAGLGAPSRRVLSFGVFFFDYDLDGRLDLLQANGHLENEIHSIDPSQEYRQSAQLFWNAGAEGSRLYLEVEQAGALAEKIVGRGSAYADIDLDGDLDVVLLQTGDRPYLVRNDQQLGHHWVRLELRGDGASVSTDAIGSTVVLRSGDLELRRTVQPARSYQSQSELPIVFGLGPRTTIDSVDVLWSDGTRQSVDPGRVVLDGPTVIEQGG
ncbi:MAG: CRTAC1 family protein [Acidobacteria bacterium]|nr:MAG: CRTAC1 family protein [Acidobacteriota bacterium]